MDLSSLIYVPDGRPVTEALARTTHLGIGAHQDDLELFAYHGIETCYGHDDRWFGGVTVTDGGGSARTGAYSNFTDAEMQRARWTEQNEAARLGQYTFQAQLAQPSRVVKDRVASAPLVDQLEALLRATRPQTVYLHNPADKHDTHIAVLTRCLEALRRLEPALHPRELYGCEVWRDLDWLDDEQKVALPVGYRPELERELIAVFRSQIEGGKDYIAAGLGRRRANATFFRSHVVDAAPGYTFALDLAPLLATPTLEVVGWLDTHLQRFRADVRERLQRF